MAATISRRNRLRRHDKLIDTKTKRRRVVLLLLRITCRRLMLIYNCSALQDVLGAVALAVYIPRVNTEEECTHYGRTNRKRRSKTPTQNFQSLETFYGEQTKKNTSIKAQLSYHCSTTAMHEHLKRRHPGNRCL